MTSVQNMLERRVQKFGEVTIAKQMERLLKLLDHPNLQQQTMEWLNDLNVRRLKSGFAASSSQPIPTDQ